MKKEIKEILKGAENYIVASENGIAIEGNEPHILTLYAMITKAIAENNDKELIDEAYNLAFLSDKELKKKALEAMKGFMERINKMSEDK